VKDTLILREGCHFEERLACLVPVFSGDMSQHDSSLLFPKKNSLRIHGVGTPKNLRVFESAQKIPKTS